MRPPFGLIGRVVAILLLAMLVEFGVSTLLYERASQFSVRDDEAHRLAEHLVVAKRLMEEAPIGRRPALAEELTTDRYALAWEETPAALPPIAPRLDTMRNQILGWEPALGAANLRLRLRSPGRGAIVTGALRLADGSWLQFRMREAVRALDLAIERILLALVPAIGLMLLGGLLIRQTLRPLRELAVAADRMGAAGGPPVAEDGPGEVRRLVAAFNRMQARIAKLIADRTQALAAVGHDLRTPLARLRLRVEAVADPAAHDAIVRDIDEMEAMVASLLAFLRGDGDPEPAVRTDVAVLCATVVDDAVDHGRAATYDGPDHCEIVTRPRALRRALTNLVDNAAHHAATLSVALTEHADHVAIAVEDDGPGIPEDQLAAVLEPFVRLDTARARDTIGFGLGLAIVRQVVAAEGGVLTLGNRRAGGLRAQIRLPRRG